MIIQEYAVVNFNAYTPICLIKFNDPFNFHYLCKIILVRSERTNTHRIDRLGDIRQ